MAPAVLAAIGAPRLVAAVDVRDGQAMGSGWASDAERRPVGDLTARLGAAGGGLCGGTATPRAGLWAGPDLDLLDAAAQRAGGHDRIIASAGISTLDDIRALASQRFAGAILGRALYEGRFELADALALAAG